MDSEIYLHSWYIEIARRIISVKVLNLFNTCQRDDGYNYYLFFFSYTLRSILTSVKMSPLILSITNFLFFNTVSLP